MATGGISGTVFDAVTKAPLPGASAYAREVDGLDAAIGAAQPPSGTYVLEGLPAPSSYLLFVGADSYTLSLTDAVNVAPDQYSRCDIGLRYAGAVSGTVVGDVGGQSQPVAAAGIRAFQTQPPYGFGKASTDGAGDYVLRNLDADPGGSYYDLEVQAPGFTSQVDRGILVFGASSIGAVTAAHDFCLSLSGSITGTVRNAAGEPVPGANVDAAVSGGAGTQEASAVTADDGTFTIADLDAGIEYVVSVSAGGYSIASSSGMVPIGGSLVLGFELVPSATVSGTVTDSSGSPVEDALVWVYPTANPDVRYAAALTAADGTYSVPDVDAPDTVDVYAYKEDVGSGLAESVPVVAPETGGVDIQFL